MRGNREEKRANEAESRLFNIKCFIRLLGTSEAIRLFSSKSRLKSAKTRLNSRLKSLKLSQQKCPK